MNWEVIGQQPTTGQNARGQYVQGQRIHIRTKAGHEGDLFVPYSDYAPEKVTPLLASLAARLDSVGKLSG